MVELQKFESQLIFKNIYSKIVYIYIYIYIYIYKNLKFYCHALYGTVQLTSNLTLTSTCKFSKTTRELDMTTRMCLEEAMTRDTRESLHCTLNHSSRVPERVIAHDNHETL